MPVRRALSVLVTTLLLTPCFAQIPAPVPGPLPPPVPENPAQPKAPAQLVPADSMFLDEALGRARRMVAIAQMGQLRATDPLLKEFMQRLLTDHSHAVMQIEEIAAARAPKAPVQGAPPPQQQYEGLPANEGPDFNLALIRIVIRELETLSAFYQTAANQVMDLAIKSFVAEFQPVVKMHLAAAQSLEGRLAHLH